MRRTGLVFLASHFFLVASLTAADANAEDTSSQSGRKWAVCIGVGKYRDAKLPARSTAVSDAKGIAAAMEEHGDFGQVFVFTDDVPEKDPSYPSRRHIQEFLDQLASKISTDDMVLFSFSGNGATDETGRPFLLSADSRTGHLEDTAIPLDSIFDTLRKTSVRRSIVLIDAARDATSGGSAQGVYPDRYLKKGVTAVFYAAARGYSSQADESSQHSVFAKNLILGLQGEADRQYGGNKDGVVTLKELASFVNLALAEWRGQTRGSQVPFIEILDQRRVDMRLSSAEKVRTARPPASGRKGGSETRAVQEQTRRKEEAVPRDDPKPRSSVSVRAPAPKIDDLIKEAKPSSATNQEGKAAPVEAAKRTASQEEVNVKFSERTPNHVNDPAAPGRTETHIDPAGKTNKEVKSNPGKPSAGVESRKDREEPARILPPAPNMQQEAPVSLSMAQVEKKRIVRLRSKPKEVTAEEMKSILVKHGFYSTCWNYNGDFCNPKGSFENQFKENGDGTVSDTATGLMWQKGGSGKLMAWASAKEYMERVNRERFAGYSDWRMPTVEEMSSLIKSAWRNGDLFVDPIFDRAQRQCWTLDTKGMDAAWKVNFHQGFLMDFPVESPSSVRLVRSLQ